MLRLLHLSSLLKRLKRRQKSFLNRAMKSDLGSELFEERTKLKEEADQELVLQMLRRNEKNAGQWCTISDRGGKDEEEVDPRKQGQF